MTPHLVQEALPPSGRIDQEQFTYVLCQHGAEPNLKSRWLTENSHFRLAFSRPGLLTFKSGAPLPPSGEAGSFPSQNVWQKAKLVTPTVVPDIPRDPLVRLAGRVIGQIKGEFAESMVNDTLAMAGSSWDAIHVFQRDSDLPGMKGFEPGPTLLSQEVGQLITQQLNQDRPAGAAAPRINTEAEVGQRVLDVVLVDPQHWLIGQHVVQESHERWPGGAYSAPAPRDMISRAYLKMAEALAWSGLPIQPGDHFVEIGSAPGGACQRLLDVGLKVTGIDPAEMDPMLLEHPRFEHWRSKSSGVRRKLYSKFRWLAADANVAPNYTLDCVEDIVTYKTSRIAGLLLTLKLSSYDLMEHMEQYQQRVRSWGYQRVEVRQLASNRRECCLVAERQ